MDGHLELPYELMLRLACDAFKNFLRVFETLIPQSII
jgi:hypothetical protein